MDVKSEPANIDAATQRELLCIPPRGTFDANCDALQWVKRVYNKKKNLCYDSAFIPADTFEDFKAGENARGQCLFYKMKGLHKKEKAADAEQAEGDAEKGVRLMGAKPNQLLRFLGIMQGAVGGGFNGLRAAMSVADGAGASRIDGHSEASDAEVQPSDACDTEMQPSGELTLNSSDMSDAQADPLPTNTGSAEPSRGIAGAKVAAERALAELTATAASWEDDSPMWRYMLVALRQAKGQVDKAPAGVGSMDGYAGEIFQPNADAPEGERMKSWLEKAAEVHRRKDRRRAAASGGSDYDSASEGSNSESGELVHPFLPARAAPKKHKSVQHDIRAKHRLHRSSAVESVELLPRSSSGPAMASLDMDVGQSMLADLPSSAAEGPSGSCAHGNTEAGLLPVPVSHSHAAPSTQLLAPRRPRRENIGRPSRFRGDP